MNDPKRPQFQPGLRMRVAREARRIASQHRQLDLFYEALLKSLFHENVAKSRSEFLRFHDALEAHFTVEERIHFPALHGLRPELDAELVSLVEEHKSFRSTLDHLAALLERKELARCSDELDGFVTDIVAHEGREERMGERVAHSG
ncbi:MAG: hemerythrin domain-containing protein [Deltaproteobacteria bacterium]|nr:hemerythrin domain-containing protein [Deltaproteobacteria bacterium]MBW2446663.1 hemerythrin domain-containing protein [Deltaproteobacteria bacterium]